MVIGQDKPQFTVIVDGLDGSSTLSLPADQERHFATMTAVLAGDDPLYAARW